MNSEQFLLDALADTRPVRGRIRRMRYKRHRRNLEASLFCVGALGPWRRVYDENELMGVWKR